jgi:hypothetical protein
MMCKLGGNWYADNWEYVQKALQPPSPSEPVLVFGWPEGGGVWCLKTSYAKASDIGVGRVANAVSMSERCDVIRRLGGIFYADPKDCPELKL